MADLLDPVDRRALHAKLVDLARRDPAVWCELSTRGRWQPARHAVVMLDEVRRQCEAGGRTILSVSVRHSKTETIARGFGSWWIGAHPDERIIHGTAEADLAEANSRAVRDRLTEWGPTVFGVEVDQGSHAMRRWDLAGREGGMTAVGRGGAPEGRGGHILVDDPYRNFADAMSPTVRKMVREWWTNSLRPRMEPGAWAIVICSRWHTEDLSGWLLDEFGEEWTEIRMPAIAEGPDDVMGRAPGEALWPERWPVHELERARRELVMEEGEIGWSARYQQRPLDLSSTMFPIDSWVWPEPEVVGRLRVVARVRGWDLAATDAGGDWTVGVRVARLDDGRFLVEDVVRVQQGPDGVRATLQATAERDRREAPGCRWALPQDPGQAGKDQAQQLVRLLAPIPVDVKPVTGAKEVRAAGWSSQQRAGNVLVASSPEAKRMVAVHATFPGGSHDDDVDAASEAFNALARSSGPSGSSSVLTSSRVPIG